MHLEYILLLEKFLRRVWTLYVALRAARNSPVHSNGVHYAIAVRLFRTVLHDHLNKKNPGTIGYCLILYAYYL